MIKYVCPICFNTNTFLLCSHLSDEIKGFMDKSHMITAGEFINTCLIKVRITYD